jgi:hypothetical protein
MPRPLQALFIIALAMLVSSCAQPRPVAVESRYTSAMFVRALENESPAPDFVLITVVDARDGTSRIICTEAPFLKGALHKEFDIPYDEAGEHRVHQLALETSDRVFRFSKPEALANVRPHYTPRELDTIRVSIAEKSTPSFLTISLFRPFT